MKEDPTHEWDRHVRSQDDSVPDITTLLSMIMEETPFSGVSIWMCRYTDRSIHFMGCLLDSRMEPDHATNCWNWKDSVEEVYEELYETAKRLSSGPVNPSPLDF